MSPGGGHGASERDWNVEGRPLGGKDQEKGLWLPLKVWVGIFLLVVGLQCSYDNPFWETFGGAAASYVPMCFAGLLSYIGISNTSSHHFIFGVHLGNALIFLSAPFLWDDWALNFELLQIDARNGLSGPRKVVETAPAHHRMIAMRHPLSSAPEVTESTSAHTNATHAGITQLNAVMPAVEVVFALSVVSFLLFIVFLIIAIRKARAIRGLRQTVVSKNGMESVEQLPYFSQSVALGVSEGFKLTAFPIFCGGFFSLTAGVKQGWTLLPTAATLFIIGLVLGSRNKDGATNTKYKEAAEYNKDGTEKVTPHYEH